ncbi:hypothetical protein MCOR25_009673 [Pyricularia grisea]|nr:hypothetical protein MCOR25_009673 [Pyricularia grisea]
MKVTTIFLDLALIATAMAAAVSPAVVAGLEKRVDCNKFGSGMPGPSMISHKD